MKKANRHSAFFSLGSTSVMFSAVTCSLASPMEKADKSIEDNCVVMNLNLK